MAKEYIDREAAIKVVRDIINHYHECYVSNARVETAEWCLEKLKELPAADVAPVRHGRWLSMDSEKVVAMDDDGCPVASCRCSECGDWLTGSDEYMVRGRYCPNCGALMDKDGDGE